jgi:hypothetical protein
LALVVVLAAVQCAIAVEPGSESVQTLRSANTTTAGIAIGRCGRPAPWPVAVVSILVGMAIKARFIHSVDDPITRYLAELQGTAWDGVTSRNGWKWCSGRRGTRQRRRRLCTMNK